MFTRRDGLQVLRVEGPLLHPAYELCGVLRGERRVLRGHLLATSPALLQRTYACVRRQSIMHSAAAG
eukprot:COSAG01_NODE_3770_length_5716_cov_2.466619_9_plen_67_part_00